MFDRINRFRIGTKIVIPIIIIAVLGNLVSNYISTKKMQEILRTNTKESLNMLTDSIFLTLRNAMNTGDPAIIKEAENKSRDSIKGLQELKVHKSEKTIEMYSPDDRFTSDEKVLQTFSSKNEQVLDEFTGGSHYLRVIRPMIATDECLMCHANQQVGDVVGVIDLKFSLDEADEEINDSSIYLLIISLIVIIITLIVVLIVVNKVTDPLKTLQKELGLFFDFILRKRSTIEPFEVKSKDEIGEMIESINASISESVAGINNDNRAIEETASVCEKVSKGNLSVKITSTSNNPSINNLNSIVNNLIKALEYNISRVLKILENFSADNYTDRINSKGTTTGEIKELFEKVDYLGDTLVRLSTQNLKNGLALQQTSDVFSKNVDTLVESSNEQERILQTATNELNDIAIKTKDTTKNSQKMQSYANEVTTSLKEGETLASKTSTSMDIINEKIEAINEAITVIDQIAFQTNILSLNAAVEAATAGEAGKGFAVVAGEVRNLANRSSEAAKEIKDLVEDANENANNGKNISNDMIEGFNKLNERITKTTELIEEVVKASLEQNTTIEQVNRRIEEVNIQTKNNAKIADETNIVAQQAKAIAQNIVNDAQGKTFDGKGDIKIRKKIVDPNYKGPDRRKIGSARK